MLIEMRCELENLRRKNVEEVENLRQENSRLKRKLAERELNQTSSEKEETYVSVRTPHRNTLLKMYLVEFKRGVN